MHYRILVNGNNLCICCIHTSAMDQDFQQRVTTTAWMNLSIYSLNQSFIVKSYLFIHFTIMLLIIQITGCIFLSLYNHLSGFWYYDKPYTVVFLVLGSTVYIHCRSWHQETTVQDLLMKHASKEAHLPAHLLEEPCISSTHGLPRLQYIPRDPCPQLSVVIPLHVILCEGRSNTAHRGSEGNSCFLEGQFVTII